MNVQRLSCIRKILVFILCFLNIFYIHADAQNEFDEKVPNVIIITFSGLRNSESIDDPTHQYISNLWGRIFKEGSLYTNLVSLNHQFHMPSVHAINTGLTYPVYGYPLKAPSIFQYVNKQYRFPKTKTWSLGHWFSPDYAVSMPGYTEDTYPCALSFIDLEISPELKNKFTNQEIIFWETFSELLEHNPERWPNWDSLGEVQYRFLRKIISEFKPNLVHHILNDIESAHSDTFARYVLALKKCDERILEIWEFIRDDPYYKDNTYLIINVDHERNLYYMDHHENTYSNPAQVWMYIYGPGVRKGAVIERPVYHTDIFATVAYLMDVKTHASEGVILKDCFNDGFVKPASDSP